MLTHPYASPDYAFSFADKFSPVFLLEAHTWILRREIPQTTYHDALGCYPRCVINPEAKLTTDFAALAQQHLISFTAALDIFIRPSVENLQQSFDLMRPFKTHYLHTAGLTYAPNKHHRYEIKQAYKNCKVSIINLQEHFMAWLKLYHNLVERHQISGMQNFSEHYFKEIAKSPNLVSIAAMVDDEIVSMHLWYQYDKYLYSHLAASTEKGYDNRAAYAIYDFVINHFGQTKSIDLGSGAGLTDDATDPLARFKSGFANDEAISYLCGKILNPEIYQQLSQNKNSAYFPAYRG